MCIRDSDNVVMESDPSQQYSYNSFYTYADVADSDYTIEISGSKKVLTMVTRQLLTHKDSSTSNTLFNTDLITFSDKARLMKMQDATGKSDESQAVSYTHLVFPLAERERARHSAPHALPPAAGREAG